MTTALTLLPQPRRVAIVVGALILLLGGIGAVDRLAPSLPASLFSLEGEHTIPAAFSATLLAGAGVMALRIGSTGVSSIGGAGSWRLMGAFLMFMALDELLAIHEKVSAPVTGMSWQVFYAPIVLAAAIAWLIILRRLPSRPARLIWLGGAAAWFVSQVIEAVQWDGDRLVHEWTFVPEEMLEMTGSLLWGLALLVGLQIVRERVADEAEAEAGDESVTGDFRLPQRRQRGGRPTDRAGKRPHATADRTPGAH